MALTDSFDRADSATALGTPSDGGAAWEVVSGGPWGISGNAAYNPGGGEHACAVRDFGESDGKLRVTVSAGGLFGAEIWCRVTDASNGIMCHWVGAGPGTWHLYRKQAGSYTEIGSAVLPGLPEGTVIGFDFEGDQVTFLVDEVAVIGPVTEAFNQAATKHGIGAATTTVTYYSDSTISALDEGEVLHLIIPIAGGSHLHFAVGAPPDPGDPPAQPTNLQAIGGDGQISLTWDDHSSDETGFRVERSVDGVGGWSTLATKGANVEAHADVGLGDDETWYYRVFAFNGAGDSEPSPVANATTDAGGGGTPGAVASLGLANDSGSATPTTTYMSFGHAFVRGDVPTGMRLAADVGGSPAAIQVEHVSSWDDDSIRFAWIGLRFGSVAGSATADIDLRTEAGSQDATIAGGRTTAQVRDELKSSFPFTVTAANLKKGHESGSPAQATDGSGAWTWSANTQLDFLGSTDSRGRVRCEAIESGPLCVTFHVWGPFTDNTGGASHPHLVVRAWYRCWLEPSLGSIDRVEHFHSLEQGWIEDLAGGSVAAMLAVGDFAVKLNGTTIAGRSWTGLRIPHHTAHALVPIDDTANSGNHTTGGSTWTSGTPTLLPVFDKAYFIRTRITPPYDVAYYDANPITEQTPEAANYAPGARIPNGYAGNSASYKIRMGINVGGSREDIGFLPEWCVRTIHLQSKAYDKVNLASALVSGQIPCRLRNPSTGRLPVLLPSSVLADTSNALMGSSRSTGAYINGNEVQSSDILYEGGFGSPPLQDPTNTEGGWYGGFDPTHWPSLAWVAYLRTGAPWLLELVKMDFQVAIQWVPAQTLPLQFGKSRNFEHEDGSITYCRIIAPSYQEREESWAWKMLVQCLAVLPDDAVEKPYFDAVYQGNVDGAVKVRADQSDNFRTLGNWGFRSGASAAGTQEFFMETGFMQIYLLISRAHEYGVLRKPGTLTILNHLANQLRGKAGGPGGDGCAWQSVTFHIITGVPSEAGDPLHDHFASWSDVPHWLGNSSAVFATDGYITCADELGSLGEKLSSSSGHLLVDGDKVMFHPFTGHTINWGNYPPSPIAHGVWYYIRDLDRPNSRFKIAATAGGTVIVPSEARSNVGVSWRLSTCPTPSAARGSIQERSFGDLGAMNDMAEFLCSAEMFISVDVIDDAMEGFWVQDYRDRVELARSVRSWAGGEDWVDFVKLKVIPNPEDL